jgi:transcriptional regulator with XRE-family HTH domain
MERAEQERLFAERVRQQRERREYSIGKLADLAGIHYQTVYRIERGMLKAPSLYIATCLARALEVSLDYLAGIYDAREQVATGEVVDRSLNPPGAPRPML